MKLTIIRTDKKKQKHITHKKLGQFAELIAQQQKKELLEPLRLIVRIGNEQLPIKHELPYVYPVVEMARNASGNPTMKALNGLVLLTSRKLEQTEQAELLKQRAMSMPSTAAAFIGASNRTVKVLVSVKRPYGRHMEDFPRLASFIATANMTDLLADPSGSRRFLSVELTGPIDVSSVPYHEQLYAQAQALIDSGYRYWFTKEEEREIMENNRQFQLRSPAEELLNEYFEITYDENEGTYLSPSAIFTYLKEKAGSSLRVTNIRSLGRMLANMEGIRRRRVNAGTQYLLKKRPK